MREETLRAVLLAAAVEDSDPEGRLVPLADREAATREGLRDAGAGASPADALVARADRLLGPLLQRFPSLQPLIARTVLPWWLGPAVVVVAFASGLALSAFGGSRHIDVLALPILGVVAWNLLVYLLLLAHRLRAWLQPAKQQVAEDERGLSRAIGRRIAPLAARAAEFAPALADAVARFSAASGGALLPLFAQHARRLLHAAAAALAIGLVAGLYLRGVVLRYDAGWDSTFLGPRQVLAVIQTVYGPTAHWAGISLPNTVEQAAALRWSAQGGGDAAPWIHLIALTLLLYVILPRLILAGAAGLGLRRLSRSIDLPAPLVERANRLYGEGAPSASKSKLPAIRPIDLTLVSHTNVGKTTLARTLLRRDVGEVRDEPHVTTRATAYELVATPEGDVLQLWDTPGFSEVERLATRLRPSGNPLGALLRRAWDRFADRDLFLSQRAARSVRDHSDVVLYVVDAREGSGGDPSIEAELQVLDWIGKPVLVLLNQLAAPQGAASDVELEQAWRRRTASCRCVRDVLAFDAFARCWIQEHALLERIAQALPPDRLRSFDRLADAWRRRNEDVFGHSMRVLARQLGAAAAASASLGSRSLGETARAWFGGGDQDAADPAVERALGELASRLDADVRAATDELIRLHGLAGQAAAEISARLGADEIRVTRAADVAKASVLGGAISGALGGLAADLAAGGLTFGAGALLGGVLGAAGARGVAKAVNLARGTESSSVCWSPEFLNQRFGAALLRYLAIAHFGRGRGDYADRECPASWRSLVHEQTTARRARLDAIWNEGRDANAIAVRLEPELASAAAATLRALYPGADRSTHPFG